MAGLSSLETTPQRAVHDINLLRAAVRRTGGIFANRYFTDIQHEVYRQDLEEVPKDLQVSWKNKKSPADKQALARAAVASRNPTAIWGYNYSDLPEYGEVINEINADSSLTGLSIDQYYEVLIRRSAAPTNYLEILNQLQHPATGPYRRQRSITIHSGINPGFQALMAGSTQPPLQLPIEKTFKRRDLSLQISYTIDDAIRDAKDFLKKTEPSDYEINPSELAVTKALSKIQKVITTQEGPEDLYDYDYPAITDLSAYLHRINKAQPVTKINSLLKDTVLRVPGQFRIAMAMRELSGGLPPGSPNMEKLINYWEAYTIATEEGDINPYYLLSAGGIRMALDRSITASDLVSLKALRGERSYLKELGETIEAQRFREHISS